MSTEPSVRDDNLNLKAKIFISYSRKDVAFADRLEQALKVRGFESLIDRQEIYAFEEWWPRIETLIASADTVVFILSPDSVASEVALKEVTFAASLSKRLAPIVHRRVDHEAVPAALAKLNFITFNDETPFNASADRLAEALGSDIGWIRRHTEFGEQARRWTLANRPNGLLLRSPALEEAESWIASRPRGAPVPTDATRAFIELSRSATTKRRKTLIASLTTGLVVAVILAGYAFYQKREAEQQTSAARRNLVASKVAQADLQLSRSDLAASFKDALEAETLESSYQQDVDRRISRQALGRIVAANRLVLHLHRYASPVPNWPFEFLSKATLAYTTEAQGLFVIDLEKRLVSWRVALPGLENPEILKVSEESEAILIAAGSKLAVVDSNQHDVVETLEFPSPIRALSLSSKSDKTAVALDKSLVLFDLNDTDQKQTVDVPQVGEGRRIKGISFDRAGGRLYVTIAGDFGQDASVVEYDLAQEQFKPVAVADAGTIADDKTELSAFKGADRALTYSSRLKLKFGVFDASTGAVSDLRKGLLDMGLLTASPALIPVGIHHPTGQDFGEHTQLFSISRSLVRGTEPMTLSVHLVSNGRTLLNGMDIKYRPQAQALVFRCRVSDSNGYLACYFSYADQNSSQRSQEWLAVWNLATKDAAEPAIKDPVPAAQAMLRQLTDFDAPEAPFASVAAQNKPPLADLARQ